MCLLCPRTSHCHYSSSVADKLRLPWKECLESQLSKSGHRNVIWAMVESLVRSKVSMFPWFSPFVFLVFPLKNLCLLWSRTCYWHYSSGVVDKLRLPWKESLESELSKSGSRNVIGPLVRSLDRSKVSRFLQSVTVSSSQNDVSPNVFLPKRGHFYRLLWFMLYMLTLSRESPPLSRE